MARNTNKTTRKQNRSVTVTACVTPQEKEQYELAAANHDMSLGKLIRTAVQKELVRLQKQSDQ